MPNEVISTQIFVHGGKSLLHFFISSVLSVALNWQQGEKKEQLICIVGVGRISSNRLLLFFN